jgi:AcrR family transcriptional regulator
MAVTDFRRADARRNREHILEVAYPAFTDDPNISLNQIAKLAGVGSGTLYRHFPSREALILALYGHEVARLSASVDDVLAEHPGEPLEAFREWFRRLAGYVRVKHGLGEALNTPAAQVVVNGTYPPVLDALDRLLKACEASGDVQPGLDRNDVLLAMSFLWRVEPGQAGLDRAERIMNLVIDGLRGR